MDFEIVKKAGINPTEFAKIMKTSRTTVYSWYRGGGIHAMVATRLNRVLGLIDAAVENGDLPLAEIPREERLVAITRALKKQKNVQAD